MTSASTTQTPVSRRTATRFDLEERTARLGEAVIHFCKTIPRNEVTRPIISQLVRASTSIGANYCEADEAESHKDFLPKIALCRKETRESRHWLRMVVAAAPEQKAAAEVLWREARELSLIFNAILRTGRNA